MAVGDAVSAVVSGAGTFFPAAGVEVMITQFVSKNGTGGQFQLRQGGTDSFYLITITTSNDYTGGSAGRVFLTNSVGLVFGASAIVQAYTGIQTK